MQGKDTGVINCLMHKPTHAYGTCSCYYLLTRSAGSSAGSRTNQENTNKERSQVHTNSPPEQLALQFSHA
eukprot:1161352-Pelagomonas_calceolata.AAC.15